MERLLDPDSFVEHPGVATPSPHLPALGLAASPDDGIVTGEGRLLGERVLVAAQEGRFMGGSIGEVHGAKLTGLLRRALGAPPRAVLLLVDSGGVRLQEANAGMLAVAESLRALLDLRAAGVPTVGVVCGRAGAFGGGALLAACCETLVMSEHGRMGYSGPKLIEQMCGTAEFDASDADLVTRTTGARHRLLLGDAALVSDDAFQSLGAAVCEALERHAPLSLEALEQRQEHLEARLDRYGDVTDADAIRQRMAGAPPAAPDGAGTP